MNLLHMVTMSTVLPLVEVLVHLWLQEVKIRKLICGWLESPMLFWYLLSTNRKSFWFFLCVITFHIFEIQSLTGHTSPVECVQFNDGEDSVVAGSQSGTMKIWDVEAAKSIPLFVFFSCCIYLFDMELFNFSYKDTHRAQV